MRADDQVLNRPWRFCDDVETPFCVVDFFFVGKKAQLFFSVTKCIQFGWCSMVEKHAPNSFAELYKKSICRLLLIELGPRVIKKPYAFLDMGWREKKHWPGLTTTPPNQTKLLGGF